MNIFLSFFYSLSVSILCYPVAGTPFAYLHSYILSLICIFIFSLAIKNKSNLLWFFLPFLMVLAFLSMQTPSAYINALIIIFLIIYLVIDFNKRNFYYFIFGSFSILLLIILFFIKFEIPIINFIQQYLLFPLTVGENRITGDDQAWFKLIDKITFRGLIGHFKFIYLFIFLIIFVTILNYFKNSKVFLSKEEVITNILLILSSFAFIFHQLIIYFMNI